MADELNAWWRDRGYEDVQFWVEYVRPPATQEPLWAIKSNLVGGLPPSGRRP